MHMLIYSYIYIYTHIYVYFLYNYIIIKLYNYVIIYICIYSFIFIYIYIYIYLYMYIHILEDRQVAITAQSAVNATWQVVLGSSGELRKNNSVGIATSSSRARQENGRHKRYEGHEGH